MKNSLFAMLATVLGVSLSVLAQPAFGQDVDLKNSDLQEAIDTIKSVDVNGKNHQAAIQAIEILNSATAVDVLQILNGMDGANQLALNWLRGGVQSALDKGPLPRKKVEKYFADKSASHMGRFMAFELLTEGNEQFAKQALPGLITDPSLPLRQLAVADAIDRAAADDQGQAGAIALLASTLPHAREFDQIQSIVKELREAGVQVSLQKQLGFIPEWHLVGPFDNRDEKGFAAVVGPEKDPGNVDLEASYDDSKSGEPISWTQHNELESTGVVDLNKLIVTEKGVMAYAYTEFNAAEEQEVEIRIGCINANKVWVNGEEVINNEIYHVGMMPDQFSGKARLAKGKNKILFKVCQNEQKQPWANRWMFQMRVCESDGKAVLPYVPAAPRQ